MLHRSCHLLPRSSLVLILPTHGNFQAGFTWMNFWHQEWNPDMTPIPVLTGLDVLWLCWSCNTKSNHHLTSESLKYPMSTADNNMKKLPPANSRQAASRPGLKGRLSPHSQNTVKMEFAGSACSWASRCQHHNLAKPTVNIRRGGWWNNNRLLMSNLHHLFKTTGWPS